MITLPQAVIISPARGNSHLKLSKTAAIWNSILELISHGQRTDARREVPTFAPKRILQHARSPRSHGTIFSTRSPLRAGRCRLCLSISSHHLERWQDPTNTAHTSSKPGDLALATRCYRLFKQIVQTKPPQILPNLFGKNQCHLPESKLKLSGAFELHVSEAGIGGFAFVFFTVIVAWLKRFKKRLEKKMQRLMMMDSVEQARAWSRRSRLGCC